MRLGSPCITVDHPTSFWDEVGDSMSAGAGSPDSAKSISLEFKVFVDAVLRDFRDSDIDGKRCPHRKRNPLWARSGFVREVQSC